MEPEHSVRQDRELAQMIAETESYVVALRTELDRRQQAAQDAEIENLDAYMADARVKWDELKDFLEIVLAELRGRATP